jgi:hypothetical protein
MSEQVNQENVEAVADALSKSAMPPNLMVIVVQAVKTGLNASLDNLGTNIRSLDFGAATPVIAMLAPTIVAAAKAWITNFQYPPVPKPPYPYPPQPGPGPGPAPYPYPPQPPQPQPYYPPQPGPAPAPYPPQPQPPYPPQPQPQPPLPPQPPRNGVDINVK